MRWLLFMARVAFICNVFFIACLVFRYYDLVSLNSLKGFIIIVGWLMAPFINAVMHSLLVFSFYRKKVPDQLIPRWLLAINLITLLLQLIIIPFA